MKIYLWSIVEDSVFGFGDWSLFVSGEEDELVDVSQDSVLVELQ